MLVCHLIIVFEVKTLLLFLVLLSVDLLGCVQFCLHLFFWRICCRPTVVIYCKVSWSVPVMTTIASCFSMISIICLIIFIPVSLVLNFVDNDITVILNSIFVYSVFSSI